MKNKEGYITISAVIIVMIVGVLTLSYVALFNVDQFNIVSVTSNKQTAQEYADMCVEEVIVQLKKNPQYSDTKTLEIGDGGCSIISIDKNLNEYTINTKGFYKGTEHNVEVKISNLYPEIIVESWLD
ncbi:MAG TPA: hypothetical protein PK957_04680 [Candidatus Dojkabacteria bacterium]|nr:hypothetical protein [Candidatus Dojkabacteria bacterium]HQF36776.1 hypothetical protein [Candidatus Dojkabacteria bacterium]